MPHFKWESHQIYYQEQGTGPVLILLPGNTATSACHMGELAHFSQQFRTVAIDFLGTGRSDRLDSWPVDWYYHSARQVKGLLKHLNKKECVVMGTSGGAVVALLAAIHFPTIIKAIVADSCPLRYSTELFTKGVLEERQHPTDDQKAFWKFAQGNDWERVVAADTQMLGAFARQGGDWFEGRLGEISCPTLITASRHDDLIESVIDDVRDMTVMIGPSQSYISASGQHPLMWSAPDEFRCVSDYFLNHTLPETATE